MAKTCTWGLGFAEAKAAIYLERMEKASARRGHGLIEEADLVVECGVTRCPFVPIRQWQACDVDGLQVPSGRT